MMASAVAQIMFADDPGGRRITVPVIIDAVAERCNVPVEQLTRRDSCRGARGSREREFAWPRQVAMYLARELTELSFPEIGRRFGNRDHSTVIWAVRTVERRISADPKTCRIVADVRRALNA